ncbi:hypothetical protein EDD16DRAFT_1516929 [Pisolithus croceorrhizus]|nr:hypothetical protein EV401DRAFT_1890938 [Pisolithus croceorrhizus]KAI6126144.1 hypothetical protein EDD16DRAFT_1516929 [Pisolithus croceorrhizus]
MSPLSLSLFRPAFMRGILSLSPRHSIRRRLENHAYVISAGMVHRCPSIAKENDRGVGWVASVGEDDRQIMIRQLIVGPSEPPFYPSNQLFRIELCVNESKRRRNHGKGVELFQRELRFLVMESYFWTDNAQGSYSNGNGRSKVASESSYDLW